MKNYIIYLLLVCPMLSIAQEGIDVSLSVLSCENLSVCENMAFTDNFTKAKNNDELGFLITNKIEIPKKENQPFITVNSVINFSEGNNNAIKFFYRTDNGNAYSKWITIPFDAHANTDNNRLFGSQVFVEPTTDSVQFKIEIPSGVQVEITGIDIRFFLPTKTGNVFTHSSYNQQSNISRGGGIDCDCPIPAFLDRLGWCPTGNCPEDMTPTPTDVSHVIVHHSAGLNTSSDWSAVVRSIWDFHVNTRGWDDVGYNYLIDPNGVIYEGRGDNTVGAHFSCMNTETIGICLLGNFETAQPTTEMINALVELSGWKMCDIDKNPVGESFHNGSEFILANIAGHRDGNDAPSPNSCASGTVCPGENLYPLLGNIRIAVSSYVENCELDLNSDIVVLSQTATPNTVLENEVLTLSATVKNIGGAPISASVIIDLEVNGAVVATETISELDVNETYTIDLNTSFPSDGIYNFCSYTSQPANELNGLNNSFCTDFTVIEDATTAINIIHKSAGVELFPNPASDILNIKTAVEFVEILIYDLQGKLLLQQTYSESINIANLPTGNYILKLIGNDEVVTKKIATN